MYVMIPCGGVNARIALMLSNPFCVRFASDFRVDPIAPPRLMCARPLSRSSTLPLKNPQAFPWGPKANGIEASRPATRHRRPNGNQRRLGKPTGAISPWEPTDPPQLKPQYCRRDVALSEQFHALAKAELVEWESIFEASVHPFP